MPVEPLLQVTLENMSSLVHLSGPPLPVLQQRITYGEHWVPPLEKTADFRKVQADLLDILNKLPKPGTGRVQRPMIVKEPADTQALARFSANGGAGALAACKTRYECVCRSRWHRMNKDRHKLTKC